jgi:hypothetical protein
MVLHYYLLHVHEHVKYHAQKAVILAMHHYHSPLVRVGSY